MVDAGVLEQVDAPVTETQAEELAAVGFGLSGRAVRLTGERDQNFRLDAPTGPPLLLKISNSAEDPAVTDLQSQALLHIERSASDIPTPRLYRTLSGEPHYAWLKADGRTSLVRLLSFLDGEPLSDVPPTDELLLAVGAALARFDAVLETFRHPAESHDLLWDVQHASRLTGLTWAIGDPASRQLAEEGLDIFVREAEPRLPALRTQLIHNDLNPHNVLVARNGGPRVTGIIDLGDMVRAPRIDDLAVAAAYQVGFASDPLQGVSILTRGYHSVVPLELEEIEALTPLIIGRLAMSVTISSWRARKDPANESYIFRNLPAALHGLEMLLPMDRGAAARRLTSVCREAAA